MNNEKPTLNQLMEQAGAFESFESFENLSGKMTYDEERQYEALRRQNFTIPQALGRIQQARNGDPQKQATPEQWGGGKGVAGSKAEFDLNITRDQSTVLSGGAVCDLPYAIFGVFDAVSNYGGALGLQGLPAGVTLQNVAVGGQSTSNGAAGATNTYSNLGQPNNAVFTFTDGTHFDRINITCNQIPYPSFLWRMTNGLFRMSKIRYQLITDQTSTIQFAKTMFTYYKSMFGKLEQNQISVGAYKSPTQYQSGIIDLDSTLSLNPCTSLTNSMSGALGSYPYTITLSGFVEELDHGNNSILI